MFDLAKHRLKFFFFVLFFVISATFAIIKFASGYRLDLSTKTLRPTGLLVATSYPNGAQVYLDGKLKTATNNTLSLSPKDYGVEIKKEGFSPWQKKIKIEKELVSQTEAFLFPLVPDLKPLTFTHVQNPQLSPDGTKITYLVPLPDPEAGLWVMDLRDFLLEIGRPERQISKSQAKVKDFGKAKIFWSPDCRHLLADFSPEGGTYLLDPNQFNQSSALVNIAETLNSTIEQWQKEVKLREEAKQKKLPEKLREILENNAENLVFSPDNSKVLYTATASAEIPLKLLPPPPAASTQKESRKIEAKKVYVYDLKEDKNFLIPYVIPIPTKPSSKKIDSRQLLTLALSEVEGLNSKLLTISWFPTSRHLFWVDKDKVVVGEYDGTNLTIMYSGPFVPHFVFATPGGRELVVLANISFDKESQPNLYSVSIR